MNQPSKHDTDADAYAFLLRVLRIFDGVGVPSADSIWWRTDGEYAPFTIFVNCNDAFWWGTADAEPLTPANVGEMERAVADCIVATRNNSPWGEHGCAVYAPLLFCARVRGMRPQGAAYPHGADHAGVRALFDACGPEREVGDANPQRPPQDAEAER